MKKRWIVGWKSVQLVKKQLRRVMLLKPQRLLRYQLVDRDNWQKMRIWLLKHQHRKISKIGSHLSIELCVLLR
jgi:hypothetical protein